MPKFAAVDGALLHYELINSLDNDADCLSPVIVISGGGSRHPSYLGDLAGLSNRHLLAVPHLRGVGESPAANSSESGSFWKQAQDIESLREHLRLERVCIVGHSAGTRLAMAYAVQFPQRLSGLILIGPPAGYLVDEPSDINLLIETRRGEPVFDAAIAAQQTNSQPSSDEEFNARQQLVAPAGYAAWGVKEQAHARAGYWNLAASNAYFSIAPPEDFAAQLGRVTVPVLVVIGARDCFTGVAPLKALSKLFPAGKATVIDECGHYPWVEQPTAFRQVLDPLVDECCISMS
ncbi:MAG TPA: alpha/beta hydrolase [Candidatus Nanopelagicaceae bacterium]|nr:alpha/beta hydrolase [Candidatus Nanopelagicaceae bacterium]